MPEHPIERRYDPHAGDFVGASGHETRRRYNRQRTTDELVAQGRSIGDRVRLFVTHALAGLRK
jgi:hypothetical protein